MGYSWEYMPEPEYNKFQSEEYRKKAESIVFETMARKLVASRPPAEPPPPEPGFPPPNFGPMESGPPPSTPSAPFGIGPSQWEGFASTETPPKPPGFLEGLGKFLMNPIPMSPAMQETENRFRQADPFGKVEVLTESNLPRPVEDVMQVIPAFSAPGLVKKGAQAAKAVSELGKLDAALTPATKSLGENLSDLAGGFKKNFYDRNHPLVALEEETKIPVHKLAQVVSGAAARGEDNVRRVILPAVKDLGESGATDLERYMALRRMEDVLARNPQATLPGNINGWQGQIQAMKELEGEIGPERIKELDTVAKNIWKANDDLILKRKLDVGILSKQAYNDIKASNPHYLDFHRADYNVTQAPQKQGGAQVASLSDTGIDAMAREGSDLALDQPLARFVAQVVQTEQDISRNQAARFLIQALRDKGKDAGEELVKLVGPDTKAVASKEWGPISWYQDGEKVSALVPREFADVAKGLESEPANMLNKFLMATAAPLRLGATTYNPAFVIINPIRDFITAGFKEGWGTVLSKDYIAGWVGAFTKNTDFSDAAQAGAFMSGIIDSYKTTASVGEGAKMLQGAKGILKGAVTVESPQDALMVIPRLLRAIPKGIESVNIASERATRIATFKHLKGQGISDLEAAVRARDVTVDFAKSGNAIKVINQAIPFLNAGIQGATNTLKVMGNPKQAIVRAAPLIVGDTMLWLWNQRYETAKMIPDYEYQNNFVFQFGEGEQNAGPQTGQSERFPLYMKIPKGPAGALLSIPAQLARKFAWENGDRSAVELVLESAKDAVQSVTPVEIGLSGITPPLLSTGISLATGQDLFRDAPIIPRREEQRPDRLKYGPETSKTAVALGQQFGISPRLIDFAIKDASAGTGQTGLWLTDLALGALGYDPAIPGEAKLRQPTEAESLARIPVASRFVGTRNTQQERRDWDKFGKVTSQSREQFSQNPELIRLGVNLGQVPDKIGERILTMPERIRYQQESEQVISPTVNDLTGSELFKKLDDKGKTALIQKAMDVSREYVRAYLAPGKTLPAENLDRTAKEISVAVQAKHYYDALPKYNPKLVSEADTKGVELIRDAVRKYYAKLPEGTPNRQYKAIQAVWAANTENMQTESQKRKWSLARNIIQDPSRFANPKRKEFKKLNPVMQKYLGEIEAE